jgi:hypothetical protein
MKNLILGNSHIACIKQACEDLHNSAEFSFAGGSAAHGNFFNLLKFDAGGKTVRVGQDALAIQHKLWELTTGSSEPLDISTFGRIFVVGLIKAPNPWNLNNCPGSSGIDLEFLDFPPMSFSLYKDTWGDTYLKKAVEFLAKLKTVSPSCDVMFVPQPLVREDAASFSPEFQIPKEWSRLTNAQKRIATNNERDLYRKLCNLVGVNVFIPDDEIVINGYRCPVKYSQGALGSRNFTPGHPSQYDDSKISRGNLTHKNKSYAKYVLEQILA